MARPLSIGLKYYPMEIDFFDDQKMMVVAEKFGWQGELVAVKLLNRIYREGYELKWDDLASLTFAKRVMCDPSCRTLVEQVIHVLLNCGFFDKTIFDLFGVLTSRGIQRRWKTAIESQKRKAVIRPEVNLIQNEETDETFLPKNKEETAVIQEETTVRQEETTVRQEETTVKQEETTHNRIKLTKVNNIPPLYVPPCKNKTIEFAHECDMDCNSENDFLGGQNKNTSTDRDKTNCQITTEGEHKPVVTPPDCSGSPVLRSFDDFDKLIDQEEQRNTCERREDLRCSKKTSDFTVPYEELIALWNSETSGIPGAAKRDIVLNDTEGRYLMETWAEYSDIAVWKTVFKAAADDEFAWKFRTAVKLSNFELLLQKEFKQRERPNKRGPTQQAFKKLPPRDGYKGGAFA